LFAQQTNGEVESETTIAEGEGRGAEGSYGMGRTAFINASARLDQYLRIDGPFASKKPGRVAIEHFRPTNIEA
jgi:hypothetical protein